MAERTTSVSADEPKKSDEKKPYAQTHKQEPARDSDERALEAVRIKMKEEVNTTKKEKWKERFL